MSDPPSQAFADALGASYALERELGRGGMATVWLARDLRHGRLVAVKILRPELGAVLGAERFHREISLTATLQHPHILPLIDSGEAAGMLYYVTPYVEGESLRQRLEGAGPLDLAQTVDMVSALASALEHAHASGIIHRDIKPENILLSQGEPMLADFGIAFAGPDLANERLTATGLSLGTPAYMSPEQACASPVVDSRSDQYSLACVVHEMLTGEPPFAGPAPQEMLARRLSEPYPRLDSLGTLPHTVRAALSRALARSPTDRFASVAEFVRALRVGTSPRLPLSSRTQRSVLAGGVLLALVGLAAAAWISQSSPTALPTSSTELVAVLPFHVAGADSTLAYLREGMVDLLSAKLAGEAGVRAVDPRAVVQAWRRSTGEDSDGATTEKGLRIAERLGAGQAMTGSIVGNSRRVVISARSLALPRGEPVAQAVVEGPLDSLPGLVDRLAARLLAGRAGYTGRRLSELASTSLPALRAYLEGEAAYRHGRYSQAKVSFEHALDADSAFALAALSLAATELWLGFPSPRARSVAWAGRDRLGPRERAIAVALAGPHFPGPTPLTEDLAAWVRAVEEAPERAEAWFYAGDRYFHFGTFLGIDGADDQAKSYLRRAAELDTLAAAPLSHLLELAALEGDTGEVSRLETRLLGIDSTSDIVGFIRWRASIARGDVRTLDDLRSSFARMSTGSLLRIMQTSQELTLDLEDADRAAQVLRRRGGSAGERAQVYASLASLALNRGRPAVHSGIMDELAAIQPGRHEAIRARLPAAIYSDGDSAEAARAASLLARSAMAPLASGSAARQEQYADICALGVWQLAMGQRMEVERSAQRLRAPLPEPDSAGARMTGEICAVLLEASVAAERDGSAGLNAVQRFDSLLRIGTPLPAGIPGNLVLARLYRLQGHLDDARAALRRRARWSVIPADYLASYHLEEARLAAAAGDRDGAVLAYQRFLALRDSPEPVLGTQLRQVKQELASLVGELGA